MTACKAPGAALNEDTARVLALMAESGQPPLETLDPEVARLAFAQAIGQLQSPALDGYAVSALDVNGAEGCIQARHYRPLHADDMLPVVVYFHGGGFVLGDMDVYDRLLSRLCIASGCAVIAAAYRLAPEHRYPAGLEDAVSVISWVHDHSDTLRVRPDRMCIAGDSAGANLATVAAAVMLKHDSIRIAHQLLLYPVTDLASESLGYTIRGEGFFLTAALMRYFRGHYLSANDDPGEARISPLHATRLAGLPPATILVCGYDPLLEEGMAYAAALRDADVPVDLLRIDDQIHGFLLMDGAVPDAAAALMDLGSRVGRVLFDGLA